ncbi:MAG TPA: metal ABC transporter permease [Gemmatales bacterium]|nr:metal ABC transporter permease [Gemmatales bacterium]HMP58390.1 metal ABC transporter permease [Gemmatales bacterium]
MAPDVYYSLVVVACGILVSASCSLLGPFLVLRRMSLVGDAISHAILPGIALGFILTHSRQSLAMTLGAAAAGLVTVWLIELLLKSRRVSEDTSVALVFPMLFALGVLLMERFARYVDLDPECVIYGDIEFAPFDQWSLGGLALGPRPLWILAGVTLFNLLLVVLLYKELKLTTFDPALGDALGFHSGWMHYILMTAVALTCVAAFESVGAILVVAFLIVPAATAYLITDRLSRLLAWSVGFGVLAAVGGYGLAREELLDCSVAGGMATMAGLIFAGVWMAAPRQGLLAQLRRRLS